VLLTVLGVVLASGQSFWTEDWGSGQDNGLRLLIVEEDAVEEEVAPEEEAVVDGPQLVLVEKPKEEVVDEPPATVTPAVLLDTPMSFRDDGVVKAPTTIPDGRIIATFPAGQYIIVKLEDEEGIMWVVLLDRWTKEVIKSFQVEGKFGKNSPHHGRWGHPCGRKRRFHHGCRKRRGFHQGCMKKAA